MAKKKVTKVVDTADSIRKARDDSRSSVIKKSAVAHQKANKK